MYTAYTNKEGNKIKTSINKYTQNYQRDSHLAYCLVCDNILKVAAASSPNTRTHFRHEHNPDCPTVVSYKERYHNLSFKNYIPEQKERLLIEIKENLSCIYNECKKLCGNALFYSEFEGLLELASRKRVWEYAHLELKHIPYCLLTLKLNFSSRENPSRAMSVFFCFSNQYVAETLWIDFNNQNIELYKFETNSKELVNTIQVNDEFLNSDLFKKDKFNEKLPKFLKVLY
jgi:hypothetical protein